MRRIMLWLLAVICAAGMLAWVLWRNGPYVYNPAQVLHTCILMSADATITEELTEAQLADVTPAYKADWMNIHGYAEFDRDGTRRAVRLYIPTTVTVTVQDITGQDITGVMDVGVILDDQYPAYSIELQGEATVSRRSSVAYTLYEDVDERTTTLYAEATIDGTTFWFEADPVRHEYAQQMRQDFEEILDWFAQGKWGSYDLSQIVCSEIPEA